MIDLFFRWAKLVRKGAVDATLHVLKPRHDFKKGSLGLIILGAGSVSFGQPVESIPQLFIDNRVKLLPGQFPIDFY